MLGATVKRECSLAACRNMIDGEKLFCAKHWQLVPRSNKLTLAVTFEAGVAVEDQGLPFAKARLDATKMVQLLEAARKDLPPK